MTRFSNGVHGAGLRSPHARRGGCRAEQRRLGADSGHIEPGTDAIARCDHRSSIAHVVPTTVKDVRRSDQRPHGRLRACRPYRHRRRGPGRTPATHRPPSNDRTRLCPAGCFPPSSRRPTASVRPGFLTLCRSTDNGTYAGRPLYQGDRRSRSSRNPLVIAVRAASGHCIGTKKFPRLGATPRIWQNPGAPPLTARDAQRAQRRCAPSGWTKQGWGRPNTAIR